MPEKTNNHKNESSRPSDEKRVDTAGKRPLAPYQQEAAEEFYPEDVIEAEPKSAGEHDEELAEIAGENKDTSPKDHQSANAGWETDNGHTPDATNAGGKSDNRGGALDGTSTRATQEARKSEKKRA